MSKSTISVVEDRGPGKGASWHFVVSETTRHTRGHTLYRVTLQVIPVDVSESIKEIIWWKRHKDFLVLHKTLSALHSALFLKGAFPSFPKPALLHRHEEHVIEERRQAAERLLNFVSNYAILCRHESMKDFLKDGEEACCTSDIDHTQSLQPKRLYVAEEGPDSLEDLIALDDDCDIGACREATLSPVAGIWCFRQDDLPSPDSSDDLAYVPPSIIAPSTAAGPGNTQDRPQSPVGSLGRTPNSPPDTGGEMSPKRNALVLSADHSRLLEVSSAADMAMKDGAQEEDYLFMAGHHLSRATDKELAGDFEVSFGLYKLGIDILLNGVQTDKDPVRRDAVRRKAAKYLAKAEQLYNDHVSGSLSDQREPLIHSEYSTAAGTRAELAEYTIVSILSDSVILAMHRASRESCILKTLSKSAASSAGKRRDRRTVIPLGPQRHMVQLRRFIETDDSVYLILERAPGGRLLDYISRFSSAEVLPQCHHGNVQERSRLRKTDSTTSVSSQLAVTADEDVSVSWNKLVATLSTTEDDEGGSDYADLFFKHALDADRSRTSSLAQVDHPASLSQQVSMNSTASGDEMKGECDRPEFGQGDDVFDWSTNRLLDSLNLSDVLQKSEARDNDDPAVLHSDVEFLQSMEPSASPTLRGLANWRDVSVLDSDQLIAKSKELLQSLDKTIQRSSQGPITPSSRLPRSHSPSPVASCSSGGARRDTGPASDLADHLKSATLEEPSSSVVDQHISDSLIRPTESAAQVSGGGGKLKKMPDAMVKVWIAEMIVAVEALHDLGIVCGDLALHNILLGDKGRIKLTYFSQWCSVAKPQLSNATVNAGYHVAPELRRVGEVASCASDVWSLGVIAFALLTGEVFETRNPVLPHTHRTPTFPSELSREAEDLLRKMLKYSPRERLSLPEIRQHPFFLAVNWRHIAPR